MKDQNKIFQGGDKVGSEVDENLVYRYFYIGLRNSPTYKEWYPYKTYYKKVAKNISQNNFVNMISMTSVYTGTWVHQEVELKLQKVGQL